MTLSLCPSNRRTSLPELLFHRRWVLPLQESTFLPFGTNRAWIGPSEEVAWWTSLPLAAFHQRMVPLAPAEKPVRPSGETSTLSTPALWPWKRRISLPLATFHSRTALSWLAERRRVGVVVHVKNHALRLVAF